MAYSVPTLRKPAAAETPRGLIMIIIILILITINVIIIITNMIIRLITRYT